MAQSKPIHLSVSKIRKQVPGNQLATAGSACVLEWPWATSQSEEKDQIFLVATSQVVNKGELHSAKACTADFLPLKWGWTETFRLNHLQPHDVQITGQSNDISLILIPTQPLHKQKFQSKWRRNKFLFDRPQLCHRGTDSGPQAAEAKLDRLYCYVLREKDVGGKFVLQCYLLEVDESGSHYLQVYGNKTKLRNLEDFDRNEYPVGSVILNESEEVVGFLVFGENDEILPVLLSQNLQGDNQASNNKLMVDMPKDCESTEEVCDGDGLESQTHRTTDTEADGDINKNKEDLSSNGNLNTIQVMSKVQNEGTSLASNPSPPHDPEKDSSDTENSYNGLHLIENLTISEQSQRSQPTEMSFVSLDRDGATAEIRSTGDGQEEGIHSRSNSQSQAQKIITQSSNNAAGADNGTGGANQRLETQKLPIQRSQSELKEERSPRTKVKVSKSYSQPIGLLSLKSGEQVEKAILHRPYVMGTLKRCLDTTYIKNVENWQYLAYHQNVSADMITRLKCQSPESQSEALFQLLKTTDPDLSIGSLTSHLTDLQMTNVVACIQGLQLKDDMKVDELLESGIIPGRFFILLDQKQEKNWKNLGSKLGIGHSALEGIKVDCENRHQNPAEEVIEIICAKHPTMTIAKFKEHLRTIERNDVKKKLDDQPGLETLMDLRDNLDLMREVTCMLNGAGNKKQIKNFKDLARVCGIPAEMYRSLQPPCTESPTEEVLIDIVGRKPSYTVDQLFTDLLKMNRKDVVEAISPYFIEEDIRALKRQLKFTDEQPEAL